MEKKTKDIDIKEEQGKIKAKIQKIRDSKVFEKISILLGNFNDSVLEKLGISSVRLEGRIKKEDSASEKIARQGVSADEIYDLIGFMLVVDLSEEYESIKQLMKEDMPQGSFIHDFNGELPENNGYSSFHMGINVRQFLSENGIESPKNLSNLSSEVQLKTYGMYTAQEATHESIYKNGNIEYRTKE